MATRTIRKTLGEKSFTAFSYFAMTLYALIVFLPLLYIIQLTLSTSTDISFRVFPKGFTFKHYTYVISEGLILRPLLNSVYLTAVCTVVSVTMTVLLAYPLSRRELLGRRAFNFLLILPMMISLGFLPRYLLVWQLGLLNTYAAIVLTAAVSSFNTIIVRNYFSSMSDSLVESARMDGCPEIRILLQIIMPIAKPAIATIALFYMVSVWNKYFDIILYITNTDKHTLQVVLRSLVMDETQYRNVTDEMQQYTRNIQYTAIVIAIIPVMIVYPLLQRHFVKGIMLGSVKG